MLKRLISLIKDIYQTTRKKNELNGLYINPDYPKTLGETIKNPH